MKITVLKRCEDSTEIAIPAESKQAANEQAKLIAEQPHVLGCRVKAVAGGTAILAHVARFLPGEYQVPEEVGKHLVGLGLAKG